MSYISDILIELSQGTIPFQKQRNITGQADKARWSKFWSLTKFLKKFLKNFWKTVDKWMSNVIS